MQIAIATIISLLALAAAVPAPKKHNDASATTPAPGNLTTPAVTLAPANTTEPASIITSYYDWTRNASEPFNFSSSNPWASPPRTPEDCAVDKLPNGAEKVVSTWKSDPTSLMLTTILGNITKTTIEHGSWYFPVLDLNTVGVLCNDGKQTDEDEKAHTPPKCDWDTLGLVDFIAGQEDIGAWGLQMFWRSCKLARGFD